MAEPELVPAPTPDELQTLSLDALQRLAADRRWVHRKLQRIRDGISREMDAVLNQAVDCEVAYAERVRAAQLDREQARLAQANADADVKADA